MSQVLESLQSGLPSRYRVDKEIGRGGMATVFLADDAQMSRRVAIKVLHPELTSSLGADRFAREIQVLAQLSHPNILPVLDAGDAGGLLFYVMPFIEGESLASRLARERQLPVEDAVGIVCEIADALTAAHAAGIVHRDIKPENVLLSSGKAVVADFGIARLVGDESAGKLTMTGMSVGTAAYMSPEQGAGEPVDGRGDLYSLACVLYELLVGQPPFSGANAMAVMARHAMEPPPLIRVVRPAVPEEIEEAVLRALEKSPVDRFRNVAEFRNALLGESTTTYTARYTARYTATRRAVPAPEPHWWTRHPILTAAAGLVVVSGAIAIGMSGALQADATLPDNASRVAVAYFTEPPGSNLRYMSDALTEGVIQQLADARVDVASASAVRSFRGVNVPAESIGKALDVGTIVRGFLERDGDGLKVTVQLWDALTDSPLEKTSFHASTDNPVALQGMVATKVADLVRRRVGMQATLTQTALGTESAEAWTLFRRAELSRKEADSLIVAGATPRAVDALAAADSLLAAAEARDPRWADVPVRRAMVALSLADATARNPGRQASLVQAGLDHAERAIRLDAEDADALNAKGDLLWFKYQRHLVADRAEAERILGEAEAVLKEAVRVDPDQAGAWATLSALYYRKPDLLAVINAANEALRADRYLASARTIHSQLFFARYNTADWTGATTTCDEARRRFPDDPLFVQCRLFLYMGDTLALGTPDVDSAWTHAARMVELTPESRRALARRRADVLVAGALAGAGLPDSARRVLDRARPTDALDPTRSVIGWEAAVRVMLGEHARAVELLRLYLAVNPEHRRGFASRTGWWWRGIQDYAPFRRMVAGG